jgi:hypothetical protein
MGANIRRTMTPDEARRICAKGGTTPGAYSWQAQVRELPIPTGQTSADHEKRTSGMRKPGYPRPGPTADVFEREQKQAYVRHRTVCD